MQKATRYVSICLVAGFLLLIVFKSFYFSQKNGGVDLRCRVVGARLLFTGHSPYFYKWQPADGEFLLDPNDSPKRLVNGNVVTPAVLYIMYPLSQLSYPRVRLLWSILELLACLATLFLVLKKNTGSKLIPAAIVILGLVCTDIWLLHVERGQMYIFYAFLFSLAWYFYVSAFRYHEFFSGFVCGLFIFFRPFTAVIGLSFLLHWKKKWLMGSFTGFVFGCLLFVAPNPSLWQDYFNAMGEYNNEIIGKGHAIADAMTPAIPAVIEGTTNLGNVQPFNISGLHSIRHYLTTITNTQCAFVYASVLILLSVLFFRLRNKGTTPTQLFLFSFLVYLLAELILIIPRGDYNIIQWVFPLALMWQPVRRYQPLLPILIAALLLLHNFPSVYPYQAIWTELILIALIIYSIFFSGQTKTTDHGHSRA